MPHPIAEVGVKFIGVPDLLESDTGFESVTAFVGKPVATKSVVIRFGESSYCKRPVIDDKAAANHEVELLFKGQGRFHRDRKRPRLVRSIFMGRVQGTVPIDSMHPGSFKQCRSPNTQCGRVNS